MSEFNAKSLVLLIGSFLIALCGVIDDILGLSYVYKFGLQALGVLCLMYFWIGRYASVSFLSFPLQWPIDMILIFVFCLGVLNAINFMDGLDGLLAGFASLCFSIIFIFSVNTHNSLAAIISVAIFGCLIGFMRFNTYPAHIFLGDTGSLTIAFLLLLALVIISIDSESKNLDMSVPLFVLGFPVIDTLRTMLQRWLDGKSVFLPDNKHFHHKLLAIPIRHKVTVLIIHTMSTLFVMSAIIYIEVSHIAGFILFVLNGLCVFLFPDIFKKLYDNGYIAGIKRLIDRLYRNSASQWKYAYLLITSGLITLLGFFSAQLDFYIHPLITGILMALEVVMMLLAILRYNKIHRVPNIVIMANSLVYFLIADYLRVTPQFHPDETVQFIRKAIPVLVLVLTSIYIVLRRVMYHDEKDITSGYDLTLIPLLLLIFGVNHLAGMKLYVISGYALLSAFGIYLFIKSLHNFSEKYAYYAILIAIAFNVMLMLK
ncbi:MAG: undecaprenyl/decaprenyl-phosphate alpha-N-acetylglucosaminyl 1-phosphate transferase [Ignavibacteriales bacterium]|nr:undecaprenyl/decaprenyl-phosphate alpha-N-acetylglucosaminyl 1-phosphate transferase [Ignavibacteriales bacterium]